MAEHVIRLRGGWEWREHQNGTSRRVALPLTVPVEPSAGVLLVRPFNKPPLDPSRESLWLQLQRVEGLQSIRLNGREIAVPDTAVAELALPLECLESSRNVLVLELGPAGVAKSAAEGNGWGDVALVIKTTPT